MAFYHSPQGGHGGKNYDWSADTARISSIYLISCTPQTICCYRSSPSASDIS